MDRPHPLHVMTFVLVLLAAIFAFVAMRVAFEARDHAAFAASQTSGDPSFEIRRLEEALVRADVIADPNLPVDDHQQLGGPWARCLTADDAMAMGVDEDAALPPSPCDTVEVADVPCDPPSPEAVEAAEAAEADGGDVAIDEGCLIRYRLDGRVHDVSQASHPADVEAEATDWFLASGTSAVDRVARGPGGSTFLHVIGQGWLTAYPAS